MLLRRVLPSMPSVVVRPRDVELARALRLALIFAGIKLLLHLLANLWEAHIGWGYFRDEFYYIACGRHLAWGYVDHGPLVAIQARASELLFGRSLAGLRLLSALAGAARIFLTGLLAWSLGGRRAAQALAMIGVLAAPQYLGTDSYLSMNSFESFFWMLCLLAIILIIRGGSERLWLLFGASAGLGLLNKPSMTFFLIALLLALLLTPQRKLLASRWAAAGIALLIIIALPNLLWQIHNSWATLEFLRNGRLQHKNVNLQPLDFLLTQIKNLLPSSIIIWGAGLYWLLRSPDARGWRWLGWTFVLFLGLMMALHAKDYYVAPIYPILFAAGGVFWERPSLRRGSRQDRIFAFPLLEGVTLVAGILLIPITLPVLTPGQWIAYTRALHLTDANGKTENAATGPFPQFLADRFGWQEEVDQVTRIYNALPPGQRAQTGILCSNYGEAGAIDFLGRNLPPAISGHNTYWLWGTHDNPFDSLIIIEDSTPEHLHLYFDSVQLVGRMGSPFSMPYERRNIYLVSGRRFNLAQLWPRKKDYI